jgi:hypothetical protein
VTATRHLRTFAAHAPAERSILFRALPLVVTVRLALWFIPFSTLHRRWSAILPRLVRPARETRLPAARIAWLVTVASRYVPGAHCLTRAVVAQYLLARAGYLAVMKIGVRKDGNRLDAHAWLEHDGVALFEDEAHLGGYTPFGQVIASPHGSADVVK